VADPGRGISPFFNKDTEGVKLHPKLVEVAPDAPVVVKAFADAFVNTKLQEVLSGMGAEELLVCGMMTQNCVTHTAISKSAEPYKVTILVDCCTTVSELLHRIALHAVSTRTKLETFAEAL